MFRHKANTPGPARTALRMLVGLFALVMFSAFDGGGWHLYADAEYSAVRGDTITVEGRIVVVGNEPFTRLRLVEKGGGGYLLNGEAAENIELRRQGPTEARVVGIPYMDIWQGEEVRYLCVVRLVELKIED